MGTCERAKVGAVIVKEGRCISWGYNGAPPGLPHCDERHGWPEVEDVSWYGCKNAIHAEENAIAFAARQGISVAGATLYTTVAPCYGCAGLIIASGICEVIARRPYEGHKREGTSTLGAAGVYVGIVRKD